MLIMKKLLNLYFLLKNKTVHQKKNAEIVR